MTRYRKGEAIAEKIVKTLQSNDIVVDVMRGQAYVGAKAMSSEKQGCQGRIKRLNKLAIYTHCRSHVLNLSIASACKLPLVRNMIESFFSFINLRKRNRFLSILEVEDSDYAKKKLVGLCKTRWVERHVCFDTCYHLYGYIVK